MGLCFVVSCKGFVTSTTDKPRPNLAISGGAIQGDKISAASVNLDVRFTAVRNISAFFAFDERQHFRCIIAEMLKKFVGHLRNGHDESLENWWTNTAINCGEETDKIGK